MFTESEHALIRKALRFTATGPLFPEWEFQSLFGLTRGEILALSESGCHEPVSEQFVLAVNGAIVNLLYYPHGKLVLVAAEVGPMEQLEKLGLAWRAAYLPA